MKSLVTVAWIATVGPMLGMTTAFAQAQALQPSFDCAKSQNAVEKLICSNSALTMLDRESARLFNLARADSKSDSRLTVSQNAWLRQRNDCASSTDKERCIAESYVRRIAVLMQEYPAARASKDGVSTGPFTATCEGDHTPLNVTFVNSNPSFAHVSTGNISVVLKQALSGSGARYEAQYPKGQARLWNKGDTAQIALPGGKDMSCVLKPVQ
ncbi:MAG: MliC family protein [Xanthobacteraceae bacterium]|nr:MliC family protein [Xanthobacteraceae bacterium]